ncbi:MAG: RrF2 family transcriptional regulator [Patescibacteria group bacterium]
MKISKRSQYGLRALLRLTQTSGYCPMHEIAEKEGISTDYLEKIFFDLEKGGIIRSKRGANGGYSLAIAPERISLKDILEVLEKNFNLVECVGERCDREDICPTASVWKRIDESLKRKMNSVTLKHLKKENE